MPKRKIDLKPELEFVSILDESGNLDTELDPGIPDDDLLKLYRTMLLARNFDERMVRLQRQGRLGTLVPCRGQEAASLGSCYALRDSDWVTPYIRELAGCIWRGWNLEQFLLFYAGHEEGMKIPEGVNDLPLCIPVATQTILAVGLAWAAKIKGDDSVVLCFFGDGATSEGDFHEAANFASVYNLPVVFSCHNNQYALSIPLSRQTNSETIAQKAVAYDMACAQVDGNDLLATYSLTRDAVERARNGGGPTLIEAITYRLTYHTTADDPSRYRTKEEEDEWERRDPILRLHKYLTDKGLIDDSRRDQWLEEIAAEIQQAVDNAESFSQQDMLDIFDYTYAQIPLGLQKQKRELSEFMELVQGKA
ncbi:MAG: pyruvate dehydrogenase (acetyl-transferring) E1 component subunit alpha [Acidobacteriota bacterium]|nr:MAG: pyruvate dehydrogenase (acetyl-transferring) E1 component subunit alpha [Acidobacteriota bacterium]